MAHPWVVALVNTQGLCHIHSTEPTLSLGFLGCRSPKTPIRVLGAALKDLVHPQAAVADITHLQTARKGSFSAGNGLVAPYI